MEFPPYNAWLSNVVKLHPIVAPRNSGAQRDYIRTAIRQENGAPGGL
jgi:hypothetical protein